MKIKIALLIVCLLIVTAACTTAPAAEDHPGTVRSFYVPTTISAEAQEAIGIMERVVRPDPDPDDPEGWAAAAAQYEEILAPLNEAVIEIYEPELEDITLGGIPCLDIKPKDWVDNGKVLVYVHGGGYTLLTARSTLASSAPIAAETGLRIVSVDYTLAPKADFTEITDQAIAVMAALAEEGYAAEDMAIYGESAGGGLAASMTLKMRDMGMEMPGALVLLCPWTDVSNTGDTYETLKDADPLLYYEGVIENSAAAYAPVEEHKNPYVSPVYGNFEPGFPPSFIQAGTKEIFLSNAVRLYHKLDMAGIPVKLDIWEGMWHAFHVWNWNIEESQLLRKKIALFLEKYLNY